MSNLKQADVPYDYEGGAAEDLPVGAMAAMGVDEGNAKGKGKGDMVNMGDLVNNENQHEQ